MRSFARKDEVALLSDHAVSRVRSILSYGFEHETYVINLPQRTDRRSEMQDELSRIGWNAKFFPAIRPASAGGFSSIGAHGCFLSHLAVLSAARNSGAGRVVILEDDVNFVRGFREKWNAAVEKLSGQEWSMFYPGHALDNLPGGFALLQPERSVLCAHFLMIEAQALPTIIEGLETILGRPAGHPLGGPMHVDGAYSTIRAQNPLLKTYAIAPVLGYQRPSRTDIREARWFDRIDALDAIVSFARKLKARRPS